MGGCLQLQRSARYLSADQCSDATPSFALMDIQGPAIVTYVYQLVAGEVSLHRPQPPLSSPGSHSYSRSTSAACKRFELWSKLTLAYRSRWTRLSFGNLIHPENKRACLRAWVRRVLAQRSLRGGRSALSEPVRQPRTGRCISLHSPYPNHETVLIKMPTLTIPCHGVADYATLHNLALSIRQEENDPDPSRYPA